MPRPVRDALAVLGRVERDPRPALVRAQGVPHHRDGLHGQFAGDVLGLDRDDAPGCITTTVFAMAAFSILICSREYNIKSRYFAVGAVTDSFGNHLDKTANSFSVLDE